MSNQEYEQRPNDVAVIGMSGRFPGANGLERFWQNLRDGVESVSFFTDEELLEAGVDEAELRRPDYVRASAVLEGIELFDAPLFGMNPGEAAVTDPQQRLFLECAWEALEHAGYDPERYAGSIGVFAGAKTNTYLSEIMPGPERSAGMESLQATIGNELDFIATRVSYKLNLTGPSITVQTACSTSLVAVHVACQSLLGGECDMALAGGVSIRVPQPTGYRYVEGGIASPDGHCRAFDADARGTIHGNGLGIVVLKRLAEAIQDGDYIHAVIRGSAVNNDGSFKIGFTAPSVEGQTNVISEAIALAGIPPETITYVETHGTGTVLGDPIEMAALTQAFRDRGAKGDRYCAIGSIKTNIGHLDTAAGVAGLIKTILALGNKEIPPSLNYSHPNPEIDFEHSPFFVNTELRPWNEPRRAGVSSFGFGGTNAHVVLEEGPARVSSESARTYHIVTLSANSNRTLERMTEQLAIHLEKHPDISFSDAAYTLRIGRREMAYRRALVCRNAADAAGVLRDADSARSVSAHVTHEDREVVFLFPGQGSQYVRMGRELYRTERRFREEIDRCCDLLRDETGFDLREVLYPPEGAEDNAARRMVETAVTQPVLFVIEYSLARYLMAIGITPAMMAGHSIGEYTAAALAGVFSLEDALKLVAARGRLMQEMAPGAMLAVPMAEAELKPLLGTELSIAVVNRPGSCAVSGPGDAIEELERTLAARTVDTRRLHTSHAFHSKMMDPVLAPFGELLNGIEMHPPSIPFLSNVTGVPIESAQATDPEYWCRHLRTTVHFADCLAALAAAPERVLLEVGPSRTLTTLMRQHPGRNADQITLETLPHPQDPRPDDEIFAETLGRLWLAGVTIDWEAYDKDEERRRVPLPTYPFERKRYWIDRRGKNEAPVPARARRRGLPGARLGIDEWFSVPVWAQSPPATLRIPHIAEGPWLIFANECGIGERIADLIAISKGRIVVVHDADRFEKKDTHCYVMNSRRRSDYTDLLRSLIKDRLIPERIVYTWSVTSTDTGIADTLHSNFYNLLYLVQALGELDVSSPIDISILTNETFAVTEKEEISPEKSIVLGPCMVIPLEYQNVTCRCIDITPPPPDSMKETHLIKRLILECAGAFEDDVVSFRGADRWVRRFVPVDLPDTKDINAAIRANGVYMITGGLGGIGLSIARHLSSVNAVNIVLVGRTGLPPREEWDAWLDSHDDTEPTSRRIRSIRTIEENGSAVIAIEADVTDVPAMKSIVRSIHGQFGGIDGVVHAAGVAGGGVIQTKTIEAAEQVFAPKVQGTLALDRALKDETLNFFVLCSSLSSLIPAFGQVDYCAANCFLDAFAHSRSARTGEVAVAIDWDGWRDVGMAATAEAMEWNDRLALAGGREVGRSPLIDRIIEESDEATTFLTVLDPARHWILDEHRVRGNAVVPGTAYIEMAREAVECVIGGGAFELSDISFATPLVVTDNRPSDVYTVLSAAGGSYDFVIATRSGNGDGAYREHAAGRIEKIEEETGERLRIDEIAARCTLDNKIYAEGDHRKTDEAIAQYGPRWKNIRSVSIGDKEAFAVLELPEAFTGDLDLFDLHPALLDTATGLASRLLTTDDYLPFWYRRLVARRSLPRSICSHVRRTGGSEGTASFDVMITDRNGTEIVRIEDFTMRRTGGRDPFAAAVAVEAAEDGGALDGAPIVTRRTGITPDEGNEVFARIISGGTWPRIIVSTRDLTDAIESAKRLTGERIAESITGSRAARAVHERPGIATPYVEPRTEMERTIAAIWQELLGIDRVGAHDNFFELGGDSVVGLRIAAESGKRGIRISPPMLFQHQTIEELARAVEEQASGESVESGPAASKAGTESTPATRDTKTDSKPSTTEAPDEFPESRLTRRELERLKRKLDGGKKEDTIH